MEKTLNDYIKGIVKKTQNNEHKDFNQAIKSSEVKKLSTLLELSTKETLVFSHAFYFTITKEIFNLKEMTRIVSDDPFMIGEISTILEHLEDKKLIEKTNSIKPYHVYDHIVISVANNKKPFIAKANPEEDSFDLYDELLILFRLRLEDDLFYDDFIRSLNNDIDEHKTFKPFQFLKTNEIPKNEWVLFLYVLMAHINGEEDAQVDKAVRMLYDGIKKKYNIKNDIKFENAVIQKKGYLTNSEKSSNVQQRVNIPEKILIEILGEDYKVIQDNQKERKPKETEESNMIKPEAITSHELFYNKEEDRQMKTISKLLAPKKLRNIQDQLKKEGHRSGICILLHGVPGTGKTESVLQMAKQTGRSIMKVEIETIMDRYVGESQKNLKKLFETYEEARKSAKTTPILLFNEADALLNKRVSVQDSTDKLSNSIQNILLEELENFKGILFATTNLASSLDKAFERRFLYKIEFKSPELAVRKSIWSLHFPNLKPHEIEKLASSFELSGGQIENIARKTKLNNIINNNKLKVEELLELCENEFLTPSESVKTKIGFKSINAIYA